MSSRSPDLVKRMTDVVDEIIPTIPVDDLGADHAYCKMCSRGRRTARQLHDTVGGRVSGKRRDLERAGWCRTIAAKCMQCEEISDVDDE